VTVPALAAIPRFCTASVDALPSFRRDAGGNGPPVRARLEATGGCCSASGARRRGRQGTVERHARGRRGRGRGAGLLLGIQTADCLRCCWSTHSTDSWPQRTRAARDGGGCDPAGRPGARRPRLRRRTSSPPSAPASALLLRGGRRAARGLRPGRRGFPPGPGRKAAPRRARRKTHASFWPRASPRRPSTTSPTAPTASPTATTPTA